MQQNSTSLKAFGFLVAIVLAAIFGRPLISSAAWFDVALISDSGQAARISGDNVVWEALNGQGGTFEVYLHNGSTVTTLTENSWDDHRPQVSGENVVWEAEDGPGGTTEIYFYDGSTVVKLTDNTWNDYKPQISGDNVVWVGSVSPGDYREIYLYDGSAVTTLTKSAAYTAEPQVSGNNVVWSGYDGDDRDIFLYDGSTVTTLTENNDEDWNPQISGNNVVWSGISGADSDIFLYDGSAVTTLTENSWDDYYPQISGENVVWVGEVGPFRQWDPGRTFEVFFYDGSTVVKLTDNNWDELGPQISGNNVVWVAPGGSGDTDMSQIYFYNGSTVVKLTDNIWDDFGARVSGNVIVWGAFRRDLQIFKASLDPIHPAVGIEINSNHAYTNSSDVALDLSATGVGSSGVDKMRLRDAGDTWGPWEAYTSTKDWVLPAGDGNKIIEYQVKNMIGNVSDIVSDTIIFDTQKPVVRMVTPFVSTRISKTTTFKVKWWATDASPSSGISHYAVRYRPSTSRTWRTWKSNTTAKEALFKGKAGVTYYFRTVATDNAGNKDWSKVYKTLVPFNEGIFLRKNGFFGYKKLGRSQNYLTSVRYSYKRGHTLVYKLYKNNGIGLVVTKGPKMGRAKIYVDGKYVTTVDAKSSKVRPRQLIYYRNFSKKGTHYLKVVNLGTPGRAKFEVDAVVVAR